MDEQSRLQAICGGMDLMDAVVVDVDDTLVNTVSRRHVAWSRVLGREIPKSEVESKGSLEILGKYAFSDREVWRKFWMLTLCIEEGGANLLSLDHPMPHAAQVLKGWAETFKLVYLTGRTENMRQLTLDELKSFGFPTQRTDLEMFTLKDWMDYFSLQSSVVETRSRLFSKICRRYNVIRVVDDYPGFFAAYRKHPVPDRIGLLRRKRYSPQDYRAQGATRVIENWKDLLIH